MRRTSYLKIPKSINSELYKRLVITSLIARRLLLNGIYSQVITFMQQLKSSIDFRNNMWRIGAMDY